MPNSPEITLTLVVATAANRVIGRDGGMPWHIPGDLNYFKQVTLGHPIIMGRKTFQAIGRPLPGRTNIVITRDANFAQSGVVVTNSLEQAIDTAKGIAGKDNLKEVMVVGGADIYRQALPLAQKLHHTEIHKSIDGDALFPELDPAEWQEISRDNHPSDTPEVPDVSYVVLIRNA